tara:strand:- start:2843 stop:4267 length:1425 start_codon:yes stop_codon:yes gene_type:complete
MAIAITQSPSIIFDQAYGANPVTISGIPTDPITGVITAEKYVLQIWVSGQLVADLRQTPNISDVAIFDIQNTLQNYVAPSINSVEQTGYIGAQLLNSANESTPYELRASYEMEGVVPAYPGEAGEWATLSNLLDFGGTKEYYQVPYSPLPYIPALSNVEGCTNIVTQAQPFSDCQSFVLGVSITDGKPSWLTDTMRVYQRDVTADDMTTISYYNGVRGTGPALANSINGWQFYQYDGNTLLTTSVQYNTQAEGGGPNENPGDGTTPVYPTRAITLATGPRNFQDFEGAGVTHYYVVSSAYTNVACSPDELTPESMHYVQRFNIIEEGCNDFPEYQFSWLNSFGFRDYFSFRKRKDRSVQINRNTYLREAADYASTSYNVNIYDRGTTVYSQTLEEVFNAFTGFISDSEALYLEGLYKSADVKVRFNDAPGVQQYQWVPVALLSNTYTEKTTRKNKLFQYDITFKLAHNLKSQRG